MKDINNQIDKWISENPKQPKERGYYDKIAAQFNIHPENARKRWRLYNEKATIIKHELPRTLEPLTKFINIPTSDVTYTYSPNTSSVIAETSEEVKNLDDVIRICKIDTNKFHIGTYVVDIVTRSVKNIYGQYEPQQFFSIKVNLKAKKVDDDLIAQKDIILDEIRKASLSYSREAPVLEVAPFVSLNVTERQVKNHALEINIPDLHIGKLAWGKESGEDYDIGIAVDRYSKAVRSLVSRVNPHILEKIILPIGNDMINVDNNDNTTTAGTHVSCDSRFGKMFQSAKALLIDTIDFLSRIAPVHVEVVPGNHDKMAMFTLGEVIAAWYHNNEKVTVSNTHTARKYVQYGENLIMYAHGHKEKLSDLPIICAVEEKQLWAATTYRRAHIGHYHHSKSIKVADTQEYTGMTVKIINSLSSNDAWHSEQGYLSLKGAEAFLYDKELGLVANYTYLHK